MKIRNYIVNFKLGTEFPNEIAQKILEEHLAKRIRKISL